MHPDLEKLIELQKIDARIAAVRAEVAALPKEVTRIEAKLAGSKAKVEAAQAAMKADESARRKHESDIKDQQEKISKYRDQSLKVKTNQEYKALLSEIEHAQAEIAKLEDKILEIMVAADARKESLKQSEATLKADTAENEKEKAHAREQTAEDEKQLADLSAQRNQLRSGVGEETLTHYDRGGSRRRELLGVPRSAASPGVSGRDEQPANRHLLLLQPDPVLRSASAQRRRIEG
jgi:uncharacterized protein